MTALPRFCTVCGEWFDGALTVLHCPRVAAVPLPSPPRLPHGDHGTIWPVPERPSIPSRYEPRRYSEHAYSDDLPTEPGYYVYRLWEPEWWGNESGSLYVGMVGENGPRRLGARLAEHRRTKSWWHQVKRIDAATCGLYDVRKEEAFQIAKLRPEHNRRTEGYNLTPAEANAARGWDEGDVRVTALTPADVAELAFAEVLAARPRTPERRAAVCLYVAATVPPAKSVQAIRNAITTFSTDATQQAALELLERLLTIPTEQETPA